MEGRKVKRREGGREGGRERGRREGGRRKGGPGSSLSNEQVSASLPWRHTRARAHFNGAGSGLRGLIICDYLVIILFF